MGLTSKSALYSEGPSCQVHPQVLFSIVDHFSRREGGQNRVIGTLLGTVGADGVVEVDSCFPVPHTETEEQVAVNTDFHATMLQLHQRVHPKQKVVGWYSTGEEVNDSSILFHDFYGQGVERPVHLLLDLGLGETRMSCKAYVSTQLKLGATVLGTSFSDIKCTGQKWHTVEAQAPDHPVPEALRTGHSKQMGQQTLSVHLLRNLHRLWHLRPHGYGECVIDSDGEEDEEKTGAEAAAVEHGDAGEEERKDQVVNVLCEVSKKGRGGAQTVLGRG